MQKVYVKAHTSLLGSSGYNNHSKRFFTELNKLIDVNVRNFSMDGCDIFSGENGNKSVKIINNVCELDWNKDKNVSNEEKNILYEQTYFTESGKRKDAIINNKTFDINNKFAINIVLNEANHYYFYDEYQGKKIAYVVWESTKYSNDFFNQLLKFDQLWVPTKWQKDISIKQGYPEEKIQIIPEGVDKEFVPIDYTNDKFTFLIAGRWDYRKSTLEMIQSFIQTFDKNKNVKLKLLVDNLYSNDVLNNTEERLKHYGLKSDNIEVIHFTNRKDYIKLIQTSDVLLSCSRGEGWNLPLIEAIACGNITICSNWGAQLYFAKGISHLINIIKEKPAEMNSQDDIGNFCEPDFLHLKQIMLDVYNNHIKYKEDSIKKSQKIRNDFSWEKSAKEAYNSINDLVLKKEKMIMIANHLSTGGLPQVFYKKAIELSKNFNLKIIEYEDLTANIFMVQKNKIKNYFKNDFITLHSDKNELFDIIENFNPKYIHLEEVPELFMSNDIAKKLYSDDRTYYITESTHTSLFDVNCKKFFPDKFLHASNYTNNKFKKLGIQSEVIEYPIEDHEKTTKERRLEILKKLGLDPNKKHILNVGLFTPGKNQSEIFNIARNMLDENIQFHFVGNLAGNFMEYWKSLIDEKPSNCIVWNERNDVDLFYEAMDLFLFTSILELNPIVIKEALSYNMKILMYNLETYCGSYDDNDNITFLNNDLETTKQKIKNILNINNIKMPKKCYITHTTENYRFTTFGLIDSVMEYSEYPIVVFTINFNMDNINNPYKSNNRVFFIEYTNTNYPKNADIIKTDYGKYVDRSKQSTYKILSMKPKLFLESFKLGAKEIVYLDSDSVVRYNVDDLMNEFKNVESYPLFTRGVYDIMLDDNFNGNIEKPLMNYLNVKDRSMNYVQSNIVVLTNKCEEFIKEWEKTCEDETILKNFEKWAPYQDETIANVLLWKYGYTKHLPMYHFNIRNPKFVEEFEKFDDTDKSKYSEQMLGFPFFMNGKQIDWSYIPYDKETVKVFHGIKDYNEMKDIILYQNRFKNEFCIIQTCDDNYKLLAETTFKNNKQYANLHGYDYISYTHNINENKSAHWQKYIALKRHIKNYKWVLFLDADCMIMNYTIKLENLIDENFNIIMENLGDRFDLDNTKYNKYVSEKFNPISSAMIFKNSNISLNFIEDVYKNERFPVDGIYDNTAVRILLNMDEKFKNSTKLFPIDSKKLNSMWHSNKPSYILTNGPKWNDNKNMFEIGDFIIHMAGYNISERVSLMEQFLPYIIKDEK